MPPHFHSCAAGISRSATVIIGFIMQRQQLGYDEAFKQVWMVFEIRTTRRSNRQEVLLKAYMPGSGVGWVG